MQKISGLFGLDSSQPAAINDRREDTGLSDFEAFSLFGVLDFAWPALPSPVARAPGSRCKGSLPARVGMEVIDCAHFGRRELDIESCKVV